MNHLRRLRGSAVGVVLGTFLLGCGHEVPSEGQAAEAAEEALTNMNYTADVTGDGKAETLVRTPTNEFLLNGKIWTDHGGPNLGRDMAQFVDVTGDKKADLVYQGSDNSFWVSVSKGVTSAAPKKWVQHGGTYQPGHAKYADVNGDKKADLIFQGNDNKFWVSLAQATNFSSPAEWFHHGGTFRGGSETSYADRNGDGRADLVFRAVNGGIWVAYSNGTNRFINVHEATPPPGPPPTPTPPPPPPRRTWPQDTGNRIYFNNPASSSDVVIEQDFLAIWNKEANYGYSCYNPTAILGQYQGHYAYPVTVTVTVWSEAQNREVGRFSAPAAAGGYPGRGQLVIPAYTLTEGVNLLHVICDGIPLVQNRIGVYGVHGPRKTLPPQRLYTNTSTDNKGQGLPYISSYDSRNGMVWHPGDYCAHPDYTRRNAGYWNVKILDPRGWMLLGLGLEGYQAQVQPLYRTKYHRYSPQVLHRPGVCASRSGYLTIALFCNDWEQERINIPCSQWVDQ